MMRYALGDVPAARRAWMLGGVRALTGLLPLVMAVELLRRLGWRPPAAFWAVVGAMVVWVCVRSWVQAVAARRRLGALRITLDDEAITATTGIEVRSIAHDRIARIVEVEGALGGLRVEARHDSVSEAPLIVSVPRGAEGFGELRARLELWRIIERRGHRGPFVRAALAVFVVAAIFFMPFALDEVVAHSKLVAASIIVVAWAVLRWTMRGR